MNIDAVRKRPGMYVGPLDDGSGLHNMLFELIGNAVNEALSGRCDVVNITLLPDGVVTVSDNGRGLPLPEILMTQMHAAARHGLVDRSGRNHVDGVGLMTVNALSQTLVLRIRRDGTEYVMRFAKGVSEAPLVACGNTQQHGTEITIAPDATIFSDTRFDIAVIDRRLRELAMFNTGLTVSLADRRGETVTEALYRL